MKRPKNIPKGYKTYYDVACRHPRSRIRKKYRAYEKRGLHWVHHAHWWTSKVWPKSDLKELVRVLRVDYLMPAFGMTEEEEEGDGE